MGLGKGLFFVKRMKRMNKSMSPEQRKRSAAHYKNVRKTIGSKAARRGAMTTAKAMRRLERLTKMSKKGQLTKPVTMQDAVKPKKKTKVVSINRKKNRADRRRDEHRK